MSNVKHLTGEELDQAVLGATEPVLVDFWAEWCGPCRMIAPVLEEVATEYADRLTVAKVNVDEHPDTATRHGVMSIPTLILFKDGKEAHRVVGYMGKRELKQELDPHI